MLVVCLNQKFIRAISIRPQQVDEWMFDVGWASLVLLFIFQVCNEIMAILARALLGWLMGAVGAVVVVVAAYMFTSVVPQNLTP